MASPKPIVAFAGLGAMGHNMASPLLRLCFSVTAFDVYPPAMKPTGSSQSPHKVTRIVGFLMCMAANALQATPLLFDPETVAVQSLPLHGTILMFSTVTTAYIDEVSQSLDQMGRSDLRLIDCPVSGGAYLCLCWVCTCSHYQRAASRSRL